MMPGYHLDKVQPVRYIFQDWPENKGNPKIRFVLVYFRVASILRSQKNWKINPISLLVGITYRLVVEWIMGIELPWKTIVGPGLRIYHGVGLVVNDGAVIGANVVLRHNVTVGHKRAGGKCPVIEDSVEIGAGSIILGDVRVGSGSRIGAMTLIVEDVSSGSIVVGNPARIVGRR